MADGTMGGFPGRYCRLTNMWSKMQMGIYGRSQVDEWAAVQYEASATEWDQQWLVVPDLKGANRYCLINRLSGKYLCIYGRSMDKGANACQYHEQDLDFQRWLLIPCEGGFRIRNCNSRLYLHVEKDSGGEGATIVQSEAASSSVWRIEPVEDSPVFTRYVNIIRPTVPERRMTIFNCGLDDNCDVVIYRSSNNEQEIWLELKNAVGESVFINKFSGKALGVYGRGKANNERLIQYTYQALPYQHWRHYEGAGKIANCHSGKFIGPYGRNDNDNVNVIQYDEQAADYQHWDLAPLPLPAPRVVPWSFNVHFHDMDITDAMERPTDDDLKAGLRAARENFKTIRELGGRMVRTDFPWKLIEPEKGEYSTKVMRFCRDYVEMAAEHGIEVICILYQTPDWAKREGSADPEKFYESYKQYCKKVAMEMGGKVRHFQLWNEPNNIFSFLNKDKDLFALYLDFPRMFHIAETGLDEALTPLGVAWESSLNFLINFVTEAEFAKTGIDLVTGTLVNVLKAIEGLRLFKMTDEQQAAFKKAIARFEALENLFANSFSWKRAVRYFLDANDAVNKNNRISIYGLDHYPGTWTARDYDDWSCLADTAAMIAGKGKKLAVAETGFTTWNLDGVLKPGLEGLEETASIIAQQAIVDPLVNELENIITPLQVFPPEAILHLPQTGSLRKQLTDAIKPLIVAFLEYIFMNEHTYAEQGRWIGKCLRDLLNDPHYQELQYINWYELKDQASKPPVFTGSNLFEVPEMHFGILLDKDCKHKRTYEALREVIRGAETSGG